MGEHPAQTAVAARQCCNGATKNVTPHNKLQRAPCVVYLKGVHEEWPRKKTRRVRHMYRTEMGTYQTLKPEAKSRVWHAAKLAQLKVPGVCLPVQLHFFHPLLEHVKAVFTLAAANQLSDLKCSQIR